MSYATGPPDWLIECLIHWLIYCFISGLCVNWLLYMLIFLRFPLFCAVRCARWRYFVTLRGAVIISRRGAVRTVAVFRYATRCGNYFPTRCGISWRARSAHRARCARCARCVRCGVSWHPSIITICFLHLLRSMASSVFNPRALHYFSTISLQVFFGLPLGLAPSTSYSIHFFTQSLSCFRNTCPYHRNLFRCSTEIMSSKPSLLLNSLFGTLSCNFTLHIHDEYSLISPFYDFCRFWSVAVNIMDKLLFLMFIFAVLLSVIFHSTFSGNLKVQRVWLYFTPMPRCPTLADLNQILLTS